eukprot:TRINITY_DN5549_c0_g1_i2.p1 TRINITY_DN5549_c0_g1~~TRINITY_DN5549_c0_g1_i2.p1  ORF type:complete len:130 (+),score=57.51 TRINITY_DN5549_c0_g1_i2:2-391(+)
MNEEGSDTEEENPKRTERKKNVVNSRGLQDFMNQKHSKVYFSSQSIQLIQSFGNSFVEEIAFIMNQKKQTSMKSGEQAHYKSQDVEIAVTSLFNGEENEVDLSVSEHFCEENEKDNQKEHSISSFLLKR